MLFFPIAAPLSALLAAAAPWPACAGRDHMPVAVPDTSRIERMPVVHPDTTRLRHMPVAVPACDSTRPRPWPFNTVQRDTSTSFDFRRMIKPPD